MARSLSKLVQLHGGGMAAPAQPAGWPGEAVCAAGLVGLAEPVPVLAVGLAPPVVAVCAAAPDVTDPVAVEVGAGRVLGTDEDDAGRLLDDPACCEPLTAWPMLVPDEVEPDIG